METMSGSACKGSEFWSLIRVADRNPSTGTIFETWYVKGPSGLYGPYAEAQARRCFNEKVGVPNATPLRQDATPVEPVGPPAPDCEECGAE